MERNFNTMARTLAKTTSDAHQLLSESRGTKASIGGAADAATALDTAVQKVGITELRDLVNYSVAEITDLLLEFTGTEDGDCTKQERAALRNYHRSITVAKRQA